MKKLIAAFAAACLLATLHGANAQIVIGTGPDISYLVIEAADFASGSPLIYEYHYTYNPGSPFDSYFMMNEIDLAVGDLTFGWINFAEAGDPPSYFLNSVTYLDTTLVSTPFPDVGPYWVQWASGGESGYPTAEPIPLGVWAYGSGVSAPYRFVGPGSWDGFIYNLSSPPPSVPEPASLLLVAGGALLFLRRRHGHARV